MEALLPIDPAYFDTAPPASPELHLLAAVIARVLVDLHSRRYCVDARAFLEGDDCAVFCEWLGWDVGELRQAVADGWRPRKKRELVEGSIEQKFRAKAEAEAETKREAGQKQGGQVAGRGRPKTDSSSQMFDQSKNQANERRTDTKRAKAAGTNRQYMADIDIIHEKKPEAIDDILQGRGKEVR